MKKIEFLFEISKAFRENNRVAILELVVNEPFHARTCLEEDLELQKQFKEHVKKDPFFQEVLAAGKHSHIGELTSKPAHIIVRKSVKEREFSVYCAEKMHPTSDFLVTAGEEPGMHQVKNRNTADDDLLTKHIVNNRNTTDFLQIFTNKDKITKEYQALKNPTVKIIDYENVEKVSTAEIEEMLDEFDKKKFLRYQKILLLIL